MTKLSDTQAVILASASQSFDGNVLPLPGSLRGGAQAKPGPPPPVPVGSLV